MIVIRNMERRMFAADLELQPKGEVSDYRPELNGSDGSKVMKEHSYQRYETLTILAGGVSKPLPESVLENAAIKSGILKNRLRIESYKPEA